MQVTYQNDTDDGFQTVTAILVTGDATVANNGTLVIPFGAGVTVDTPWNIQNGELVYVGTSTTYPVAGSGAGTIGISTGSGGYTLTNRTGAAWGPGTYLAFTARYRVGLDAANADLSTIKDILADDAVSAVLTGTAVTGTSGNAGTITINGHTATIADGDTAAAARAKIVAALAGDANLTVTGTSPAFTITAAAGVNIVLSGTSATLTAFTLGAARTIAYVAAVSWQANLQAIKDLL